MLRAVLKSTKTTALAFLLAINGVLEAVIKIMDGDVATNPDWNIVIALWVAAFGLLFARDADKSSQDAGIRK